MPAYARLRSHINTIAQVIGGAAGPRPPERLTKLRDEAAAIAHDLGLDPPLTAAVNIAPPPHGAGDTMPVWKLDDGSCALTHSRGYPDEGGGIVRDMIAKGDAAQLERWRVRWQQTIDCVAAPEPP